MHDTGRRLGEGGQRAPAVNGGMPGAPILGSLSRDAALLKRLGQRKSGPFLHVPGEDMRAAAEDRGFEPRRVLPPNRISSALLRVTDTSARVRDCAGTQVTTAFTCRAVPELTGTARPFCACLVRAQCVRADRPVRQAERSPATNGEPGLSAQRPRRRRLRPPFEGPGPNPLQPDGDLPWP